MEKTYDVRFWNKANECIRIGGKFVHTFDTLDDAMDAANALVKEAHKLGAVEMDINDELYEIKED